MFKDLFSKRPQFLTSTYRYVSTVLVTLATILIFIAGQLVGLLLVVLILSLFGLSTNEINELLDDNNFAKFGSILLVSVVSISLIASLLNYIGKNPIKYLRLNKKPDLRSLKLIGIAYGLYFVSFIVVVALSRFLLPGLNVEQEQQLGISELIGTDYLWIFLMVVVVIPITEEVIFRGFLYRALKSVSNIKIAIVITSLVFAAAHLEFLGDNPLNFIAAIDTFVLSLFLIGLYEKTNSLWPSIILHGLKNSIAFTVLFII